MNPFLQPHSAALRLWHWLTFILITVILFTVIINSTLLNPRENAAVVQNQLKEQGFELDERQSFIVAHYFDDELWHLHKYAGYGVAILLLLRIVAEFSAPKEERLRSRLKNAMNAAKSDSEQKAINRHFRSVIVTYSIFYILILFMVLTGLTIAFGRELGIPREINGTIKEVHEMGQWLMYAFLILHIGGVIIADLGKAKGVVSGMINGNK